MYEYIPQKTNQKAVHGIGISLLGGVAVLAMTTLLPTLPFRWAVQLVGIALLTAAIFLYTRYMTKSYVYCVVAREDGSLDFLVDEHRRKSRMTVCRVGVAGISETVTVKASEKDRREALKKRIRAEGRKVFEYGPDLMPETVCYLLCEEGGEPLAILIQPDETLLNILQKQ